jgi:hypothetical protein
LRTTLLFVIAAVALLNACNFFDTTAIKNKADNERKLKELQWALLIPPSSPSAVPTAAPPAPEPATATPEGGQPATVGAEPGAAPSTTEPPATSAATPAAVPAEPAPTETAGNSSEAVPGAPVDGTSGVAAVEHDPAKAVPTTVAVIAVVDTFTLVPASEDEDPIERARKLDLAQRRERVVRQELQNVLVANSMITVVQPNETQIAAARAEIGTTNSAALSNTMLPGLAETLGVQHVVTALCDLDGGEVNVVAQLAPDGTIVFQDTLIDWDVVLAVAKEAEAEAKAAAAK